MDPIDGDGESGQMTNIQQTVDDLSPKQQQVLSRWLSRDSSRIDADNSRRRLAAYVTGDADVDQVHDFLADRLPGFMVPDSITVVESIPRLANGKIDYAALPDPCQRTDESVVLPNNDAQQVLATIWKELLHTDLISIHDNFFEIGGDSIISIQVVSRARESGLNIQPQDIAKHPTIAELAANAVTSEATAPKVGATTGEAPPTPIQSWFLNRNLASPEHWNQTRLLELSSSVSTKTIKQAIQNCLARHDALRSTFHFQNNAWTQKISSASEFESRLDVVSISSPDAVGELDLCVEAHQSGFMLNRGPLIRFVLQEFSDQSANRLLIIAHHLVIDHVSWSILIDELRRECDSLISDEPLSISRSTSMMSWMQHLQEYARSDRCRQAVDYWSELPDGSMPVDFEFSDQPDEATAETLRLSLDPSLTEQLLAKVNVAYNTRADEIVMTALAQTLLEWKGTSSLCVDVERHGREQIAPGIDLSSTIGWFTSFFPISIALDDPDDSGGSIKQIKELVRSIPVSGIDYGVLRYLSPDKQIQNVLAKTSQADILFNYLGVDKTADPDVTLSILDNKNRWDRASANARSHLLEVNSGIWDGRLTMLWTFSHAVHMRDTIERLATKFQTRIVTLIEHCQSADAGGMTPTDFPESGLNQDELDELLGELE